MVLAHRATIRQGLVQAQHYSPHARMSAEARQLHHTRGAALTALPRAFSRGRGLTGARGQLPCGERRP